MATNQMRRQDDAVATFGGGCFWCMQPPFDNLEGVLSTEVGYMGGYVENPAYEQVSTGETGHVEVIHIYYDSRRVGYETLLGTFWRNIDPVQSGGQFRDRGSQYRTVIFYHNEQQRQMAEASKRALDASGRFERPVVTTIEAAGPFYPAEDYHQQYYRKQPQRYQRYKQGSGREVFIERHWPQRS